ncbi:hypothetical protein SAMN05216482_9148 [Streptomyces sp. PAN_FS17]|nr:hypothetical protein SAMN05216482_9148 [Streptomyces sp. PAN_FS17]
MVQARRPRRPWSSSRAHRAATAPTRAAWARSCTCVSSRAYASTYASASARRSRPRPPRLPRSRSRRCPGRRRQRGQRVAEAAAGRRLHDIGPRRPLCCVTTASSRSASAGCRAAGHGAAPAGRPRRPRWTEAVRAFHALIGMSPRTSSSTPWDPLVRRLLRLLRAGPGSPCGRKRSIASSSRRLAWAAPSGLPGSATGSHERDDVGEVEARAYLAGAFACLEEPADSGGDEVGHWRRPHRSWLVAKVSGWVLELWVSPEPIAARRSPAGNAGSSGGRCAQSGGFRRGPR